MSGTGVFFCMSLESLVLFVGWVGVVRMVARRKRTMKCETEGALLPSSPKAEAPQRRTMLGSILQSQTKNILFLPAMPASAGCLLGTMHMFKPSRRAAASEHAARNNRRGTAGGT